MRSSGVEALAPPSSTGMPPRRGYVLGLSNAAPGYRRCINPHRVDRWRRGRAGRCTLCSTQTLVHRQHTAYQGLKSNRLLRGPPNVPLQQIARGTHFSHSPRELVGACAWAKVGSGGWMAGLLDRSTPQVRINNYSKVQSSFLLILERFLVT